MTDPDQRVRSLFAHNLRRLRQEAELSLRALSELTGITHGRISEYESSSRSCTIETVARFANAFDVPVAALFDETSFGEPAKWRKKS